MKIGILGTRGIPNHYGGFEQFAEQLAVDLVVRGHEVWVYNSHNHPYQQKSFHGVQIVHCFDPEFRIGTAGQFVYDFLCVADSRKRGFDILLQLGYTSNSIWKWFLPGKPVIVTNMDGMEWKRSKYSDRIKAFLKLAEKWAVESSDYLVADSIGIQSYLASAYGKKSVYIPYGCTPPTTYNEEHLYQFQLKPGTYNLLIARMEPENNIETIIQGYIASGLLEELIVIGNYQNGFGTRLKNTYGHHHHIRWMGAIYNMGILNSLRHFSHLYFHGHSVGGTNPSLLEAMACQTFIIAHNNEFNEAILGEDALYFSNAEELALILSKPVSRENEFRKKNLRKIMQYFTPKTITDQYENLFQECLASK
ncbi:MAG TPA: DUF1972 domain-containing protein [Catalimonadaceae bacterium]|nr:DUF1972 domain-containing protein [Catalimonadaceae bacterium]HPI10442.1 DUF1972 domain-containing protein [Catalimonadaceae bacterium]